MRERTIAVIADGPATVITPDHIDGDAALRRIIAQGFNITGNAASMKDVLFDYRLIEKNLDHFVYDSHGELRCDDSGRQRPVLRNIVSRSELRQPPEHRQPSATIIGFYNDNGRCSRINFPDNAVEVAIKGPDLKVTQTAQSTSKATTQARYRGRWNGERVTDWSPSEPESVSQIARQAVQLSVPHPRSAIVKNTRARMRVTSPPADDPRAAYDDEVVTIAGIANEYPVAGVFYQVVTDDGRLFTEVGGHELTFAGPGHGLVAPRGGEFVF